ncbi:hypothetical protein EPUS_00228 [Endocarpon pusillum Z07020]|uniref:Uncharacterized protein n=1 Tax=Endocarpon pusillum (strain Z07020 / HMAS-L-300199) TaxID=1263415 RepID=U1HX89_ENDPU|nr:uncharacterized protein EPUS_00228 [Endocarpon pusillum Z07020]ERF75435.1 hypothetical protein EPUS_00228 [Endocarpon pusillum Z07020]
MDADGFEIVTRKDKKRSSSPRSGGYRNRSWSPPPNCMPDAGGQSSSKWSKRRSSDQDLCIRWKDERELSAQSQKKDWHESLVKAKKKPWGAQKAIIRKGVHQSPHGDGEQHITVDYQTADGVHITTWHVNLTDDEYQSFQQINKPEGATWAVPPSPSPAWDDAALSPPPSP